MGLDLRLFFKYTEAKTQKTLTNYIRNGTIPKGRKLRGRNELIWFKDELINALKG